MPLPLHLQPQHLSGLGEANIVGLFTKALTADVYAVLADKTGAVGADTACASTFSVATGAGEPDVFVSHD